MIVEIDLRGEAADARLVDPENFTAFKVVVHDATPSLEERLASLGVARVDEHVWVRVDTLRRLAGPAATPAWEESLASMLEFARSRGWVDDETDSVRAHVERPSAGV